MVSPQCNEHFVAEESALGFVCSSCTSPTCSSFLRVLQPVLGSSRSHCLPSSGDDMLCLQLISPASLAELAAGHACWWTVMQHCSQLQLSFQTWRLKPSRNSTFLPNKNLRGCDVECLWSKAVCRRLLVGMLDGYSIDLELCDALLFPQDLGLIQ